MVSFAFAFGPSASKVIEGVLMIAVRRPYGMSPPHAVKHILSDIFICMIAFSLEHPFKLLCQRYR